MSLQIDKQNLNAWMNHFRTSGPLVYPDERIITFLAAHFGDREANRGLKAFDVGFGSGRHLALLADYGFEVYGIDYNEEAVDGARERFAGNGRVRDLVAGTLDDPPFPPGMFDVVVAYGVMFLRPLDEMRRDFGILNRLLKPGGKMVVNFRSKDNWFYGRGIRVSGNTYSLDETAGPYGGMIYTFLDADEARALLEETGFAVMNSERLDLWKENATKQHSWHIFWARKDREA